MQVSIRNKWVSLGGSSTVKDMDEKDVLFVKGKIFSFTRKKFVQDLSGNTLFVVRNKFWRLFQRKAFVEKPDKTKVAMVRRKIFSLHDHYYITSDLGDLQIIDIAGDTDDIHKNIESDFINDANAFLCLFDISNVYSLDKAIRIMESYKSKISSDLNTKKWYLVGNKKDLDKKGNEVPNYYKTKFENYFEISTKNTKDEVFQRMIRDITHDLNLSERENRFFNNGNISQDDQQIEIEQVFSEECKIF